MSHNGAVRDVSLAEYINQIANELTERIEHQRQTLLKVAKDSEGPGAPLSYCVLVDCGPRKKYREAVQDAVRVLEETRRAFKSRQLEELRKRLEALLAADADRRL